MVQALADYSDPQLKAVVAANRVYADIVELVERALAWLDAIPPQDCLRRTGLTYSKFAWLPPWFRTTLFP